MLAKEVAMKLTFITRKSTKKIKPQEVPLFLRLRDESVDIWQKTAIKVAPEKWDQKTESLKSRMVLNKQERDDFADELFNLKKFVSQRYDKDYPKNLISKAWLVDVLKLYGKQKNMPAPKERALDFEKLYRQYLSAKNITDSRKRQHEVVLKDVLRFEIYERLTSKKTFRFNVKTITHLTLRDLWEFLDNEHELCESYPQLYEDVPKTRKKVKRRGTNSLVCIFKRLRAFINWCKDEKIISTSPFEEFSIPTERYGTPIYITKEEMHQLYNLDLSEEPALERQRDIFIFQCCVGCRVGDLIRLTKTDIINGSLEYIATKTIDENQETIVVPLNKTALAIIDKYKEYDGEFLFPFISPQKYNSAIKSAFKKAGITRNVTWLNPQTGKEEKKSIDTLASSHMARRTFVGNLYKQVLDPNIVASMSGHAENSRAFSRYREIDREIKTNAVNLLD